MGVVLAPEMQWPWLNTQLKTVRGVGTATKEVCSEGQFTGSGFCLWSK
jgi:hypothetical protein